jgi:hypothetical protein
MRQALVCRRWSRITLSLLAEALNFDFASKGIDEPFTTEELQGMQGMIGIRDSVLKRSGKANPSARLHHLQRARAGRGRSSRRSKGDRRRHGGHVREPRVRRLRCGSRPMCPAPMPISSPTWSRSCSGGAFITRTIRGRRCVRTSVCRVRRLVHGRPRRPRRVVAECISELLANLWRGWQQDHRRTNRSGCCQCALPQLRYWP